MKKTIVLILLACCVTAISFSQSVSINTDGTAADNSALLDVKSTAKGLLIPRMTTVQRTAIASPAKGLMVYDTDINSFWFYNGNAWTNMASISATADWSLTGNSGTNPNANFLGTSDKNNLVLKSHSLTNMVLDTTGNVLVPYYRLGVGTSTPQSVLDVYGSDLTTAYAAFRSINNGNNNRAADFMNTSSTTIQPAIFGYVVGENNAAEFLQANDKSQKAALYALTSGLGGAGYFTTSNGSVASHPIVLAEYTGPASGSATAICGLANTTNGRGGYFSGGYKGIEVKGSVGGVFNTTFKGLEVNLNTTTNNGGFYEYGIDCEVVNTANTDNIIGINSTLDGKGATGNVIGFYSNPTGSSNFVTTFFGVGNINITGAYYSSSDRKLKQNIQPMESVLDKLMQLAPSTYEYKTETYKLNLPKGQQFGLVAQDVQKVFPQLVAEQWKPADYDNKTKQVTGEEVKYLGVNYMGLIPVMIEGIQEQERTIKRLEQENGQLKKDMSLIKAKLGL